MIGPEDLHLAPRISHTCRTVPSLVASVVVIGLYVCRLGSIPNGAGSMVKYVVSFFSSVLRLDACLVITKTLKIVMTKQASSLSTEANRWLTEGFAARRTSLVWKANPCGRY